MFINSLKKNIGNHVLLLLCQTDPQEGQIIKVTKYETVLQKYVACQPREVRIKTRMIVGFEKSIPKAYDEKINQEEFHCDNKLYSINSSET